MEEIWKPMIGFEKYYECCIDGRLKRLKRTFVN